MAIQGVLELIGTVGSGRMGRKNTKDIQLIPVIYNTEKRPEPEFLVKNAIPFHENMDQLNALATFMFLSEIMAKEVSDMQHAGNYPTEFNNGMVFVEPTTVQAEGQPVYQPHKNIKY